MTEPLIKENWVHPELRLPYDNFDENAYPQVSQHSRSLHLRFILKIFYFVSNV